MTTSFTLDPRLASDTYPLARFELCELRLMDDSHYPWLILVPRLPDLRDLVDLNGQQRHLLSDEIERASILLRDAFRPYKLNVAALGNVVAQVHVIARFESDLAWPAPVWGRIESKPYTPESMLERVTLLQALLAK